MALDSSLNEWVDSVPDHRACCVWILFSHSLTVWQFGGIRSARTLRSLTSRPQYGQHTTRYRYSSTSHTSNRLEYQALGPLRPLQYARMQPELAVVSSRFTIRERAMDRQSRL
jgi:hypothetical protein